MKFTTISGILLFSAMIGAVSSRAQSWDWATSGGGTSNDDFCQAIGMDS